MSTQAGLSRRRVAAASNDDADGEPSTTRPGVSPTSSTANGFHDSNGRNEIRASHAGTAMEGGSKVAYDPRDLVGAGRGGDAEGLVPKLTILEEILLLGIKDRAVS